MKKLLIFCICSLLATAIFGANLRYSDSKFYNYTINGDVVETKWYRIVLPPSVEVMPKDYYETMDDDVLENNRYQFEDSYSAVQILTEFGGNKEMPDLMFVIDVYPYGELSYEEDLIDAKKKLEANPTQLIKVKNEYKQNGMDFGYDTINGQLYIVTKILGDGYSTYLYQTSIGQDYGFMFMFSAKNSTDNKALSLAKNLIEKVEFKEKRTRATAQKRVR